jgi:hypothetical protein
MGSFYEIGEQISAIVSNGQQKSGLPERNPLGVSLFLMKGSDQRRPAM